MEDHKAVMIISKKTIDFLLIVMMLIETLSYTYLSQTPLYYGTSILYFLSGLCICFLPLFLSVPDQASIDRGPLVSGIFIVIVLVLFIIYLPDCFRTTPIDYHMADMLPRIKIYVLRFIHGNYVYDDVKEIWGGNLPPYLPAVWMPFILPAILGFDMRWVPSAAFLMALVPKLKMVLWRKRLYANLTTIVLLVSLFLLINFHLCHSQGFWTMSYEGLIAFYYVLLCAAIISWNPYWMGITISLCLMSRFSLSFWVPVFLIFLWWQESFIYMAKAAVSIAIILFGVLIFPFVVGHVDVFLKTIDQYETVSKGFWRGLRIDEHLYNEVGLFKFFHSSQIALLRHLQLIFTLVAPMGFIVLVSKYFPSF